MKKQKDKKKAIGKESMRFSTTDWQNSRDLKTTIYLANEEGEPVVLIRFDNFDNDKQAQNFIDAFKDNKQFEEQERTLH